MARKNYTSAEDYFQRNVNTNGPIPEYAPHLGPCWLWIGYINSNGYGRYAYQCEEMMAHTKFYEDKHGPIPPGLEPDHRCRVRNCCRPEHIEAVSHKVNTLRGFSPPAINARKESCPVCSTEWSVSGSRRYCKECNRRRANANYEKYGKPARADARIAKGWKPVQGVSAQENRDKDTCKRGHALDGLTKDGRRFCRECYRAANRALYHKKKATE